MHLESTRLVLADYAQALGASYRSHRPIHALALLAFVTALVVQSRIGGSMYYGYAFTVCSTLFFYPILIFAVLFAKRYLELALIEKAAAPATTAMNTLLPYIIGENALVPKRNAVNFVNFLVAFIVFAISFAALKSAIAVLHPFAWDETLRDADRAIHFGRLPHEWLSPILDHPSAVFAVNFLYNIWYFVVLGALFFAGFRTNDPYRARFIASFFAVWLFIGFFIAVAFSSAGPCYFERIGLGGDYAPLMAKLNAANAVWPIWALQTQDLLWSGFKGEIAISPGISAFPSIHVATVVLIALWAFRQNQLLGWLATAYAAIIMVGSVALGWHYAVDGYASLVLTVLIWKIVGFALPRDTQGGALAAATPASPPA